METQTHWSFLKESDSSFGMFYPKHYTLAGFDELAQAEQAGERLRSDGFADDDVHIVSGRRLVEEMQAQQDDSSWLDRVKASISEFIGTETYFIDQDIALASRGGCFLFVYTPEDEQRDRAERVLLACDPIYARRYLPMAIERLVEPRH